MIETHAAALRTLMAEIRDDERLWGQKPEAEAALTRLLQLEDQVQTLLLVMAEALRVHISDCEKIRATLE